MGQLSSLKYDKFREQTFMKKCLEISAFKGRGGGVFCITLPNTVLTTSPSAKTNSVARMGGGKKNCGQFLDFQRVKALASVILSEKVPG